MAAVRAIGFDLDHTLAIDNQLERVALLRLLDVLLSEGARTIGTFADEIDDIDELLRRQRHGEFSIDEAVRQFVAAHSLGPTQEHVDMFRHETVDMVDEFVVALPGARDLFDALSERGIAVAVLSNGWNPLQACKAAQTGFRGPVLVSSEIGEQKPAAAAFERLLQRLETSAQDTWYVGDDPAADVAGAQAVGMQAIWFNWERKQYPANLPSPAHTIARLDELLALLPVGEGVR